EPVVVDASGCPHCADLVMERDSLRAALADALEKEEGRDAIEAELRASKEQAQAATKDAHSTMVQVQYTQRHTRTYIV
ncbi:hypothetical protein KIPB_013736, partial [Kipferlia bialata]